METSSIHALKQMEPMLRHSKSFNDLDLGMPQNEMPASCSLCRGKGLSRHGSFVLQHTSLVGSSTHNAQPLGAMQLPRISLAGSSMDKVLRLEAMKLHVKTFNDAYSDMMHAEFPERPPHRNKEIMRRHSSFISDHLMALDAEERRRCPCCSCAIV